MDDTQNTMDAHGPPINTTLATFNNSPGGLPLDDEYNCEEWLHNAVASMYAGVTVETLAPSIKSDCYRCSQAICHAFSQNYMLHSPDGTQLNCICTIPRPTLWTLHQMLPNRDIETGGTLAFHLCINNIAQTFVERFTYKEKRDLILTSYQTASTTLGGIALNNNNLGGKYIRVTDGNLANASIHLIRFVANVDDDDISTEE